MLSFRLFTLLLVFSLLNERIAESDDKAPFKDGESTPSSVLNSSPTTTIKPCGASDRTFLRKSGYWCSNLSTLSTPYQVSFSRAETNCKVAGYVVSSFETEEEWNYYINRAQSNPISNVTSIWLGVGYNECTNKYYWNDGNAIETLEPQPTVLNATGKTAWFLNEGSNTPGKRVLKTVDASPGGAPYVRGYVCGKPGRT
uniref:C-type lectin domain-containing protein n=1 Tax=Caenorhabditis tropicalis TaxID=1561998 RepID=A0A1I7V4B0_9PELO